MTTPIRRHAALAVTVTVVVALAGCGSHRSGASGAPSRENPNAAPGDITNMVTCFRAHGMPYWPDPNYDPRDGRWHLDGPPLKAETRQACASVIPHATPASPVPATQFHDLLQYAQCMRSNGAPGWPDPTIDGVFVTNLDPKADPAVQAAAPVCEKYLASSGDGIQVRRADGQADGWATVSEETVKSHVSNVLGKLGLADRTQAAIYALRHGVVD